MVIIASILTLIWCVCGGLSINYLCKCVGWPDDKEAHMVFCKVLILAIVVGPITMLFVWVGKRDFWGRPDKY